MAVTTTTLSDAEAGTTVLGLPDGVPAVMPTAESETVTRMALAKLAELVVKDQRSPSQRGSADRNLPAPSHRYWYHGSWPTQFMAHSPADGRGLRHATSRPDISLRRFMRSCSPDDDPAHVSGGGIHLVKVGNSGGRRTARGHSVADRTRRV